MRTRMKEISLQMIYSISLSILCVWHPDAPSSLPVHADAADGPEVDADGAVAALVPFHSPAAAAAAAAAASVVPPLQGGVLGMQAQAQDLTRLAEKEKKIAIELVG